MGLLDNIKNNITAELEKKERYELERTQLLEQITHKMHILFLTKTKKALI